MFFQNVLVGVPEPLLQHYTNLLGAYYNKPIHFDETNIATVLKDIIDTIDMAEEMGSISVVQKPIESVLSKQNQILWRSMESNPVAWIDLCYRIRSEHFFGEALKFLAGKWGMVSKDVKSCMNDEIRAVAKKKSNSLKARCRDIDSRLAALYLGSLTRNENDNHTRQSYSNDVMIWMALSFFRHWFGQAIARENGGSSPDRGYAFYQRLRTGGEAYLDRESMNQFHQRFTMSKKGRYVIENHILEIKNLVKEVVDKTGILSNNTQLDTSRHPVEYLLCTEISEEDIPWLRKESPAAFPDTRNEARLRHTRSPSIDDEEEEVNDRPVSKRARKDE
jgi:hypothetical protein